MPRPLKRTQRLGFFLTLIAVVCGALFRLHHYFYNRSLWMDEAALALNIINRSFQQILLGRQISTYLPTAPAGFLLAVKALGLPAGYGESALRFIPLAASLTAFIFLYALMKKESPFVRHGTMLFFALSPYLIYFAAEFKPYASDVFFALFLLWGLERLLERRVCCARSLAGLIALGGLALFSSYPAVFVLLGAGGVKAVKFLYNGEKKKTAFLGVAGFFWGIIFLHQYFFNIAPVLARGHLSSLWRDSFLGPPYISLSNISQIYGGMRAFFSKVLCFEPVPVAVVVAGLGAVRVFRLSREKFFFWAAPVGLTLLAAALQKYPFNGRLVLFLVPTGYFFVGHGLGALFYSRAKGLRILGAVLAIIWVVGFFKASMTKFSAGYQTEDSRAAVFYYQTHRKPGDVLLMNVGAQYAYGYYIGRHGIWEGAHDVRLIWDGFFEDAKGRHLRYINLKFLVNDQGFLVAVQREQSRRGNRIYSEPEGPLFSSPGLWVIFSHTSDELKEFTLGALEQQAKRVKYKEARGAAVYYYLQH